MVISYTISITHRGDNSYQGGVTVQPGLLADTELHQPVQP